MCSGFSDAGPPHRRSSTSPSTTQKIRSINREAQKNDMIKERLDHWKAEMRSETAPHTRTDASPVSDQNILWHVCFSQTSMTFSSAATAEQSPIIQDNASTLRSAAIMQQKMQNTVSGSIPACSVSQSGSFQADLQIRFKFFALNLEITYRKALGQL